MAIQIEDLASETPRSVGFQLVGDLDADGAKAVKKAVAGAVAAGHVDVTVNLDRVGVLESAGLAGLIASLRIARDKGGDVRLTTTNERIRKVLEVTALSRVFKLQPQRDLAA